MFESFYNRRRVLVTGHTGFKGAWICEWLLHLGANVAGYSLDPQPHQQLFGQLKLESRLTDHRGDLKDQSRLQQILNSFQPEVIFHLAAQPLVKVSYLEPVETFATNIMGTVHLLDSVRLTKLPCTLVCVTTDKCYENRNWIHAYREEDAMGGHDPYSASKAAAEIVISSFRSSYFSSGGEVRLASARAGNVIGGGDWAPYRIVPDCINSVRNGKAIPVRNKMATRPWQHVLEPLSGYLHLGAVLSNSHTPHDLAFASAFNFGPGLESNRTVADLVETLIRHTGGKWQDASVPNAHHEAARLNLSIDKAFHLLGWKPAWDFEKSVEMTANWYQAENGPESMDDFTRSQILEYEENARSKAISWAV